MLARINVPCLPLRVCLKLNKHVHALSFNRARTHVSYRRIVGKSMAKLLTFTGRQIDGREAYRIGLADDLVHCSQDHGTNEDGSHGGNAKENLVIERAMSIADEIARNGPLALASAKAAIEAGSTVSGMRQALDIEGFHYDKVLRSEDRLIALEAFSKKQTPVFTGR